MASRAQIRGLLIAAGIGLGVVLVYAVGVGTRLGWLGVGLAGLLLLYVCVRLDLHGGKAAPGGHVDKSAIDMLTRQAAGDSALTGSERAGDSARRTRLLYLGRGLGVLLSVLGLGMFVLERLQ